MKLDVERCLRGMQHVVVRGEVNSNRLYLIEEAIARFQSNPAQALSKEYLGIKNYAAFGDQRNDCKYGYGPKHGHIVFSIRLVDPSKSWAAIAPDVIYLLEAVRDFSTQEIDIDNNNLPKRYNLCDVLRERNSLINQLKPLNIALEQATVDTHNETEI